VAAEAPPPRSEPEAPPEPLALVSMEPLKLSEDEALVRFLSDEERQQSEKVSAVQKLYRLNTAEKVITALKGTREERAILVRDPNRIVAAAVLGSPRLTNMEVEGFAAMKNVSEDILRYIGKRRDWTKRVGVRANLVRNPRTPLDVSLGLVAMLNPRDLQNSEWQWVILQLGGLMAVTIRSFRQLESKLTAEEREQVLNVVERAKRAHSEGGIGELGACLEELRRAVRLLDDVRSRD